MQEIWSIKTLSKREIKNLTIWSFNINKHNVIFKKPMFLFFKKKILITGIDGKLLEFDTIGKAASNLTQIQRKSEGFTHRDDIYNMVK